VTVTTTIAAMLAAVRDSSEAMADDTPRLALADALEETDPSEGGDADWAELIRVQCEVERLRRRRGELHGPEGVERIRSLPNGHDDRYKDSLLCGEICDLLRRERALRAEHEARWRRGPACERCGGDGFLCAGSGRQGCTHPDHQCPDCAGTGCTGPLGETEVVDSYHDEWERHGWRVPVEFRRGFIARVETPLADVFDGDDVTEWAVRVARWPCVCLEELGLTDREPWESVGSSAGPNAGKPTIDWWAGHEPDQDNPDRSLIPPTVLAKIISQNPEWHHANSGDWIECPTEAAARLALARAVAKVAREAAE
jgi:uncharacterized protein (TIGR02996 family)